MVLWQWLVLAVGISLTLSLVVGVAIAAILGSISRDVSRLLEADPWTPAPQQRDRRSLTVI